MAAVTASGGGVYGDDGNWLLEAAFGEGREGVNQEALLAMCSKPEETPDISVPSLKQFALFASLKQSATYFANGGRTNDVVESIAFGSCPAPELSFYQHEVCSVAALYHNPTCELQGITLDLNRALNGDFSNLFDLEYLSSLPEEKLNVIFIFAVKNRACFLTNLILTSPELVATLFESTFRHAFILAAEDNNLVLMDQLLGPKVRSKSSPAAVGGEPDEEKVSEVESQETAIREHIFNTETLQSALNCAAENNNLVMMNFIMKRSAANAIESKIFLETFKNAVKKDCYEASCWFLFAEIIVRLTADDLRLMLWSAISSQKFALMGAVLSIVRKQVTGSPSNFQIIEQLECLVFEHPEELDSYLQFVNVEEITIPFDPSSRDRLVHKALTGAIYKEKEHSDTENTGLILRLLEGYKEEIKTLMKYDYEAIFISFASLGLVEGMRKFLCVEEFEFDDSCLKRAINAALEQGHFEAFQIPVRMLKLGIESSAATAPDQAQAILVFHMYDIKLYLRKAISKGYIDIADWITREYPDLQAYCAANLVNLIYPDGENPCCVRSIRWLLETIEGISEDVLHAALLQAVDKNDALRLRALILDTPIISGIVISETEVRFPQSPEEALEAKRKLQALMDEILKGAFRSQWSTRVIDFITSVPSLQPYLGWLDCDEVIEAIDNISGDALTQELSKGMKRKIKHILTHPKAIDIPVSKLERVLFLVTKDPELTDLILSLPQAQEFPGNTLTIALIFLCSRIQGKHIPQSYQRLGGDLTSFRPVEGGIPVPSNRLSLRAEESAYFHITTGLPVLERKASSASVAILMEKIASLPHAHEIPIIGLFLSFISAAGSNDVPAMQALLASLPRRAHTQIFSFAYLLAVYYNSKDAMKYILTVAESENISKLEMAKQSLEILEKIRTSYAGTISNDLARIVQMLIRPLIDDKVSLGEALVKGLKLALYLRDDKAIEAILSFPEAQEIPLYPRNTTSRRAVTSLSGLLEVSFFYHEHQHKIRTLQGLKLLLSYFIRRGGYADIANSREQQNHMQSLVTSFIKSKSFFETDSQSHEYLDLVNFIISLPAAKNLPLQDYVHYLREFKTHIANLRCRTRDHTYQYSAVKWVFPEILPLTVARIEQLIEENEARARG